MQPVYTLNNYRANVITNRTKDEVGYAPRDFSVIHPMFGLEVAVNLDHRNVGSVDAEYQDYVPRELGISKEIYKNNRILKGLAAPADYLNLKNANLVTIGNELAGIYRNEYVKMYNRGFTPEEAKEKALKYTKKIEEFRMKEHNQEYPDNLTKESMNRYGRKNRQGDLGVNYTPL